MGQIAEFSTQDETKIINELLSENKEKYSLYDIFENLPFDITYNNKRGYLSVSRLGIEYTSLSYDNKLNIVFVENTDYSRTNIFDCFIKTLQWFKKNESSIIVNILD